MRIGPIAWLGLALAAGCAPALDWREVRPDAPGLVAMFPCKPERAARAVALAGATPTMRMLSCRASDTGFALAIVDAGDPAAVTPTLEALRAAAASNFGAVPEDAGAAVPPGATPNPRAGRLRLAGRAADGSAATVHVLFFARGTFAVQATVYGAAPAEEAVQTFFEGLRADR